MHLWTKHLMIIFATLFVVVGSGMAQQSTTETLSSHTAPISCCINFTGNIDNDPDDITDIADLTGLIDHLFIKFPDLECPEEGNVDGDRFGLVDIADLTFLIDHLFINFPPTARCPVSYFFDVQPILSSKCAIPFCHGTVGFQGGLTMGDGAPYIVVRNAFGTNGAIINAGFPELSSLYLTTVGPFLLGDQMPPGGPFLSLSEKSTIAQWISDGAIDN